MSETVRVGVIGVGGMGAFHATTLAAMAGVDVVAVADPEDARRQQIASAVGAAAIADPTELASSGLDGIVIASPDDTHADLALAALAAGSWVLCEKPLATSLADARRVVDAEVALGVRRLQLGLMREYDPAHRQLVEAIERGARVDHIRAVHRNANTEVRSLDRIIRQSLVHDIHSVRFITGAEIVQVSVFGGGASGDSFRYVAAVCRLDTGGLASIEFDDLAYAYEVTVEVVGSEGDVVLGEPTRARQRRDGGIHVHVGADWFGRFGDAYAIQDRAWVDSIRSRQATGPTAWDGCVAETVVAAMFESLAAGGHPVVVEPSDRPSLYDA